MVAVRKQMAAQPLAVASVICVGVAIIVAAVNLHSAIPDTSAVLDLSPHVFISQTLTPWSKNQLGQPDPGSAVAYLPMALLYVILEAVKLPLVAVQGVWIVALVAGSGIGMAWLYQLWTGRTSTAQVTASGLLYALSPYMWLNMKGATALLIPYALTPVIAALAIRSIRGPTVRNVSGLIVVSSFTGIAINPPEALIAAVIVVVLVLPELLQTRGAWWSIQWCTGIGALAVGASIWWLGPFLATIHAGGTAGYFTTDPLSVQAASSSFREVLRLTGLWALYSGYNGVPYYPEATYLNSSVVVVVTLLAPALFAASLGRFRAHERWRAAALGVLVVVAVPLAVSIYPPADPGITGRIYAWLSAHVYVFRAFRSNYKWVAALACGYALAIPLCMERTVSIVANWRFRTGAVLRDAAALCVTALIVVYSVPGIGGLLFPTTYRTAALPQYWTEAGHWLTAQPGSGRVLFLPFEGFPNYTWGDPSGPIASVVTTRPSLMSQPGIQLPSGATKLLNLVAEAGTGADVPLAHVAAMLGVRYIVDQRDIAWRAIGSPSPAAMSAYLKGQTGIRQVKTFGKLSIYEVTGPITPLLGEAQTELEVASDQGISGVAAEAPPDTLVRPRTVRVVNSVVARVSASSVWSNLEDQYGPQQVLDGVTTGRAWVSGVAGGIGQWVKLTFRRPTVVPEVTVVGRQDGVDAVPTMVKVMAGRRSEDVKVSNGVGTAVFHIGKVNSVKISIEAIGPGGTNVGISAVEIPGVPLDAMQYPTVRPHQPFIDVLNPGTADVGDLEHIIPASSTTPATVTGRVSAVPTESDAALKQYLRPTGLSSISASSRWNGLAAYSPLWTLANDPAMAWVPANPGGIGAWVQYTFPGNRFIGSIGIEPRNDGVDGVVNAVEVSVDGRTIGVRSLAPGHVTNVSVDATGSVLRLTIVGVTKGKGKGLNVGLAKVVIPGVSVKRVDKVFALPNITDNGRVVPIVPAGLSRRDLDELAVGGEALSINPIEFHLMQGNNVLHWNVHGLLTMGQVRVSGGIAAHAIIHAVGFAQLSSVEMKVARVQRGLLSLNVNTDGEWSAAIGGKSGPGSDAASAFGTVWSVPRRETGVVIVDHGGVAVVEWLELQAVVVSIVGCIGGVWLARRRHVRLHGKGAR